MSFNEENKNTENVNQNRMYWVEWGIGITTEEDFLEHLFTCRANALQNKIKDKIIAKVTLQKALEYSIDEKRIWFRENLNQLRISYYEDTITVVLSRENILDETINQFSTVDDLNLHKDIKIFFIDEDARDAGGVIREWLSLVTQQILMPESKNFELVKNGEESFYTIHPECSFEMCHFAGQIFGKATFEGIPIDCRLSRLLLMKVLAVEPEFDDLKYYDEVLYSSMAYLNNDNINLEDLWMTYTLMDNGKNVELIENGNEIPITKENKAQYFKSIVDYYTSERTANQTFAFVSSFLSVIPHDYCSVFSVDEFEQILFGQKDIDVEDWKAHTYYKGKYAEVK